MNFLITGGAGFIGSAVCRKLVVNPSYNVVNYDKLTYAGNIHSLDSIKNNQNYTFVNGDITDSQTFKNTLEQNNIDIVMHLAAESHVDRSIDGPEDFIETNIVGTFRLLNTALEYYKQLSKERQRSFRFHHISTDEVFGDLPFDSGIFTEESKYAPSSPYSASKASSDHLVRAWHETYGLPIVMSNCSNNYGPYHFPEKLIPLVILNALDGKELPVFGKGENIRDWLFVSEHAEALELVATKGRIGESYNIGGNEERKNIDVVLTICKILDERSPRSDGQSYATQIKMVTDRPGHDRRYAVDASKIKRELGWQPTRNFKEGISETVDWYLNNEWWWEPIRNKNAFERLGKLK